MASQRQHGRRSGAGRARRRQWGVVSLAQLRALGLGRARGDGCARRAGGLTARPPRRLRDRRRCAPSEGGASRRCWRAGRRGAQPRQRGRRTGGCSPRRATPRGDRARVAAPARGSACTVPAPSMPGTPPPTEASRSPPSPAPCSTSPRPPAAHHLERALGAGHKLHLYDHAAITDTLDPRQRPPRHQSAADRRPRTTPRGRAATSTPLPHARAADADLPEPLSNHILPTPPTTPA